MLTEFNQSLNNCRKDTIQLNKQFTPVGINGDHISVFGIENLYGNLWTFVDGIQIKDDGYYIAKYSNQYDDINKYTQYSAVPFTSNINNQHEEFYFKSIEKIKLYNFPNSTGGTTNTCYGDYFWSHRKSQINICIYGGESVNLLGSGIFTLSLESTNSRSNFGTNSRLMFLP